jgi:transcriptional regulator with XRE-family HTH domain
MGHTAHGHISELESGKKLPTVEFVLRLARVFNVTTDELLKDELEISNGDGIDAPGTMGHAEYEPGERTDENA